MGIVSIGSGSIIVTSIIGKVVTGITVVIDSVEAAEVVVGGGPLHRLVAQHFAFKVTDIGPVYEIMINFTVTIG